MIRCRQVLPKAGKVLAAGQAEGLGTGMGMVVLAGRVLPEAGKRKVPEVGKERAGQENRAGRFRRSRHST